MKIKNIGIVCLLPLALALFASCLDSDYGEDTTLYDDIAITEFHISTANIIRHATSSTGEDSTYVSSGHTMTGYPFNIDQLNGQIYNVDSLPVGTIATKLLCDYSTKNNAIVYITNAAGDSMRLLQTTDSIDFSFPRKLRAFSSNGLNYRDYEVRVGVHQESGDQFRWTMLGNDATVAPLQGMSLVAVGDSVMLLAAQGDYTYIWSTPASGQLAWTKRDSIADPDAWQSAVVRADTLYTIANGSLVSTTVGRPFGTIADATGIARLVGQSTVELYAAADDATIKAWRHGQGWLDDAHDIAPEATPTVGLVSCTAPYAYVDSTDYVLLVGNRDPQTYPGDSTAVVWRKVVEYASNSHTGQWVVFEADNANPRRLPAMEQMALLTYGNVKLAFGRGSISASQIEPFGRIYVSRDNGVTWTSDARFDLPDGFDASTTAFAATVDSANNIWIVCGGTGQVWRGRLNSMGWEH